MSTKRPEPGAEEALLLDAVLAAPSEDGPRLVYADWLMEHGESARGELIVVQCTREACERTGRRASATYRVARARERVLLTENVKRWVDPIGLRRWWGDFSRGFITRLTISPEALRSKWSAFFARMPLQSIKLHIRRARRGASGESITLRDISWLAAQPEANRLEAVLIETSAGVAELDWQALRPNLVELGLAIGDSPETDLDSGPNANADPNPILAWQPDYALPIAPLSDFVRALTLNATSAHIADLNLRAPSSMRSLTLTSNDLDAEDLALLLSTAELRDLRELSLQWLTDDAAARALDSNPRAPVRFPHLRKLVVTGRDRMILGSRVARALCSNRILQTIESLQVGVAFDEHLIRALETRATQLKHLDVLGQANDYAIDALARSPLIGRLESLSLVGAPGGTLGPPSALPLLRADLARLSSLSLESFLIGDGNAQAIKNAATLGSLIELRLVRCGLTDQRARTIASSPYLGSLTSISLLDNGLTPAVAQELRARWPDALVHS